MTELAWVIGIGIALYLLFRFPRQMLFFVAAMILCGLGIWGYFYRDSVKRDTEKLSVVIETAFGKGCSDPAYPIGAVFRNRGDRRLLATSFTLEGREPGHSNTVYSKYLTWDGITEPQGQTAACWSLNTVTIGDHLPSSLEWSAKVLSVTFE